MAVNRKRFRQEGGAKNSMRKRNGSKTKIEVVKVLRPIQELKQRGIRWRHNPKNYMSKKEKKGNAIRDTKEI